MSDSWAETSHHNLVEKSYVVLTDAMKHDFDNALAVAVTAMDHDTEAENRKRR
jgi:hypothetical protein